MRGRVTDRELQNDARGRKGVSVAVYRAMRGNLTLTQSTSFGITGRRIRNTDRKLHDDAQRFRDNSVDFDSARSRHNVFYCDFQNNARRFNEFDADARQSCENSAGTQTRDRTTARETFVPYRSPSEYARTAANSGRPDVESSFSSVKIGAGGHLLRRSVCRPDGKL